jgi:LmbE family N-acetylglucosaminyl deacetylase
MTKTLVVIPAHADDAELNAGGTIAKWVDQGGQVHVIMTTDNCSGAMIPPGGDIKDAQRWGPAETSAKRFKEQEAACRLYDGKLHRLNYSQRHCWDPSSNQELVVHYQPQAPAPAFVKDRLPLIIAADGSAHAQKLGELLVSLQPDLILTQTPLDLDSEHHATAAMVWKAQRLLKDQLGQVPVRFWMPGSTCQDGLVAMHYDYFEDISDYFEQKLKLCACHASQMSATRWDMVKERAAFYGSQQGVRYAEPFMTATSNVRFGWGGGLSGERRS